MKVIFMGTPDFAVPALAAIAGSTHEVVAVYTKPPARSGRGHKVNISPVHKLADELNIPVFYPASLRSEDVVNELSALNVDIIVVAAYGLILPQNVLDICAKGCLNIHPSLLPRWRGAAPIERTILTGDKKTGVYVMQMDAGLDTGDLLLLERYDIADNMTSNELSKVLAAIGAKLVVEALDRYDELRPVKQSEEGATYAKKLSKEESVIDWSKSAFEIDCMVRGLNPWPGCFFRYKNELIKILQSRVVLKDTDCEAGMTISDDLQISCGKDVLQPLRLQRPGKNPISLAEFLRGCKIPAFTRLHHVSEI